MIIHILNLVQNIPVTTTQTRTGLRINKRNYYLLFCRQLHTRHYLDLCLSRTLNLPLEGKCLVLIDDSQYILTLDYTIKMLKIHERHQCGIPVVIQGETGVGKTALVEMLSKLWNHSLCFELKKLQTRLLEYMILKLEGWI